VRGQLVNSSASIAERAGGLDGIAGLSVCEGGGGTILGINMAQRAEKEDQIYPDFR